MVPENILWAFYSPAHYQLIKNEADCAGNPTPKDQYYKDSTGKWVLVTAVYECIDLARRNYRHGDAKYLGAVLKDTKGEVERGGQWPPKVMVPAVEAEIKASSPKTFLKKKKKRSINPSAIIPIN